MAGERQFDYVEVEGVNRSKYDMSYDHPFTTNMGFLDTALVAETLPGDNWYINAELFQRMAPFIAPVMHRIDTFQYAFYIPNRLIWRNWNDFQKNSADTTTFVDNKEFVPPVHPYFTLQQLAELVQSAGSADYISLYSTTINSVTYQIRCLNKKIINHLENLRLPINPLDDEFVDEVLVKVEYSSLTAENQAKMYQFIDAHSADLPLEIGHYSGTTYVRDVDIVHKYGYSEITLSSLPLRAYFKIWFDWFRDKNLESVAYDFDADGQEENDQLAQLILPRRKCWEHDYFTSALPDPQRGPDVALSVSGDSAADVRLKADAQANNGLIKKKGQNGWTNFPTENSGALTSFGGTFSSSEFETLQENAQFYTGSGITTGIVNEVGIGFNAGQAVAYDPNGTLEVPIDISFGFTINELRYQSKLQQFYETFARVGNRIKEWLKAFFNVDLSDARAMISEYYGGTRVPVQISSVEQTSQSDENTRQPLGQLAGRAQTSNKKTFDVYCPESGFVFVIQTTIPQTKYMNALPTMYRRSHYLDYCLPIFQSLGEQEVKKSEIFFDMMNDTSNDAVFGYQARYQDMKCMNDIVCGDFKRSLSFYTLARSFRKAPSLNADFVNAKPTTRMYAVEDEDTDHIWNDCYFGIALDRNLAYYSIPKLS